MKDKMQVFSVEYEREHTYPNGKTETINCKDKILGFSSNDIQELLRKLFKQVHIWSIGSVVEIDGYTDTVANTIIKQNAKRLEKLAEFDAKEKRQRMENAKKNKSSMNRGEVVDNTSTRVSQTIL